MDNITGRIQAVAFDAVGTLIEPNPSVAEAYRRAAAAHGVEVPAETIRSRFAIAFAEDHASEHRTSEDHERFRWRGIVAACLPELPAAKIDPVFDLLWDHFADPEHWRVFDDVESVLESLKSQGLKLCVASNFDSRLRRVCAGLGLTEAFEGRLVISSEVGVRKPGKSFYDAVLRLLGTEAGATLFVGDDLTNDCTMPARLGFETALIDRKDRFDQQGRLTNLAELPRSLAAPC